MFFPWYDFTLLAFESNSVVSLRFSRIAQGGPSSFREIQLMVEEKMLTGFEACAALAKGVAANEIVDLYRSKVASNETHLSAAAS